jgi:predicted dehydrogenase
VKKHRVGVIMNGVTGRMGQNQHLIRSVLAIRDQGGVRISADEVIWPDPILVGRDEDRVRSLAKAHGLERWSTDLDACLADPADTVYFDAQRTTQRATALAAAIRAGKHVYCEKPVALDLTTALDLARAARAAGVRSGVVADKLFLPGFVKLRRLIDAGFFGRIIAARGEFGYWVFEGDREPSQRPSWNYRAEDGGGIVFDMFPFGVLPRCYPHPHAFRRGGHRVRGDRRGRRVCDIDAGRRDHRPDELIVGHPCLPR